MPEKKKIKGFNGIRTHGLCVSAAVLYQLSYDPYIGSRPFYWVHLNLLCYVMLRYAVLGYFISYNAPKLYLANLAAEGLDENGFQIEQKI